MIEEIKNIQIKKTDLRKFGITAGFILLIIAGLLFWKENESFHVFLTIGIILCSLSIALPIILKPIFWIWMICAIVIQWIITRIILSLIYYLIITPVGLIGRLLGKQFLELKWNSNNSTYWNYRLNKSEVGNYKKQF